MKLFLSLSVFILFISCTGKYDKYEKVPDYITNASGATSSYFKAYDETLQLWDVSFEELYIPTTYGIAHVIVSGPEDAEPVVLLHGMNASSTMWYPNIKALSENHCVFAIDLIVEVGKSHVYNDIESMGEVIDWYNEVLFVLELDKFHMIGASKGGWLAVKYALSHPKKIKSLVLLSPAQTFTWIRPSIGLLKNITTVFSSKQKQLEQSLESLSSNATNISDIYVKQYEIGLNIKPENKFILSMRPFSNSALKSLGMPILVLIGDNDIINNEKTLKIANRLPKGKGEVIINAGHFLSIDQADTVNEKMLVFLKKSSTKLKNSV